MSGADHAILDLGEEDLQFTSTDYKAQTPSSGPSLTEFPSPGGRDDQRLIGEDGDGGGGEGGTSAFWTLAFYQQLFDVDTVTVRDRLVYSMVPVPGKSFLQHYIRPKPDLYGPFWVCVTLIFSIAISGNVSDFLQKSAAADVHQWHYDFHKVSMAASAVFSYAALLPASLYGFLWYAGGAGASGAALSFLELVCLYGYSLAIYVPVSLLWLIQVSWWQWICVLAGAGLSGFVLFTPIWPAVRDGASKGAVLVMALVLLLHLLLACGFMLYFFHVPPPAEGGGNVNTTVVVNTVKEAEAKVTGEVKEQEPVKEEVKEEVKDEENQEKKVTSKREAPLGEGDRKDAGTSEEKDVEKTKTEVKEEEATISKEEVKDSKE